MSPRSVLEQYLELCSNDLSRLVFQLASNAVLEWNGLTVRGAPKIVKFLRQKQQIGLVQSFPEAAEVQPFEERETHIATKMNPPENLISAATTPRRGVPQPAESPSSPRTSPSSSDCPTASHADLSYETPPRTLPAAPHPPPLTAGRRFLSCSSDDEDEAEDTTRSSPSKTPDKPKQSAYSELQYLEAIGTIRTANEPKHRGTRTTHHIPREDPSADSAGRTVSSSSSSAASGEKRTKLRVSYRKHLVRSDEVQFALIIYEHITTRATTVRRNLFSVEQSSHEDHDLESISPRQRETGTASPELIPLPDSPPQQLTVPPEVPSSLASPVQPPGTPVKRRRIPPIIGIRTSPRRTVTSVGDSGGTSSGASSITIDIQHTWPRKKHPAADGGSSGGGVGGSEVKYRKLSSSSSSSSSTSSSIRKPLRF